ncbi:hypothetical protein DP73_19735 [Desulfosporosinus sp. HMP52]|nr:hypothetical protein DP73_19735 [Desulfosporosinus sp. HMP52]
MDLFWEKIYNEFNKDNLARQKNHASISSNQGEFAGVFHVMVSPVDYTSQRQLKALRLRVRQKNRPHVYQGRFFSGAAMLSFKTFQ